MLDALALALLTTAGSADAAPADADALYAQSSASHLTLGETATGALGGGDDTLPSGEFVDSWVLEMSEGERVRVAMSSSELDTYLIVRGPGGFTAANDDAPGRGTNSTLVFTAPASGVFTVQATSYSPGERGSYSITALDDAMVGGLIADTGGDGNEGGAVSAGQAISGSLSASDDTLRSGEYYDAYVYEGSAGERLTVSLSSGMFDTYLMLRGPGGFTVDNDDISTGQLNSRIETTLPADGPYRVLVTSYEPSEVGAYELDIASAGGAPSLGGGTIGFGAPVSGTLDAQDPTRPGGQHFESWRFQGSAGQTVTIDLASRDLDTHLTLRMPNGGVETNDDAGSRSSDSRINLVLPASGEYEVVASSYLARASGSYTLSVSADSPAETIQEVEPTTDASTVAIGGSTSGRLNRRDEQLSSGEYFDSMTFQGSAGQGLTISMTSSQFDTYIMVRGPGGYTVDNDDGFSDGTTNSRVEVALPSDGTYTILATSYAPGETGRYEVLIEEGTSVSATARGRVFAILAGITDYADASDLQFCAEDAVKLGETLGETGILADESIVLTNGEVTMANLEQAFLTVAERAGPDDVFLFFYSGHGSHVENRRELDGRDETLYVIDGNITDDQVNSWFSSVEARMGIIALDSCFSGGFARDVISEPDRMGIFSSEEDVTSNVASRFQAGGYLSYFLRTGLGGAADVEPRDGMITAGELSQYLRRQWADHMTNEATETTDAAGAYQHLVIDRGSVKVTDVIVHTP